MSAEDIKQRIDIEDPFARSLELRNRIFTTKLYFLEKMIAEGGCQESEYEKIVISKMGVVDYLVDRYHAKAKKERPEITPEEMEKFLADKKQEIVGNIKVLVQNNKGEQRIDAISSYVRQHTDQLPRLEDDGKLESVGLVGLKHIKGNGYEAIEGIKKSDDLLELHFDDAFSSGSKPSAEQIKMWLSKIAEIIVDKYSDTTAVVGKSWIMSHPIMERLGFSIKRAFKNGFSNTYWLQILNKDGQIDSDRLDYLLANGELPYPVSYGSVSVEDFLSIYLPENRLGEITMKRADEKHLETKLLIMDELSNTLKGRWGELINGDLSIDKMIELLPNTVRVLKELNVYDKFRENLEYCVEKKLTHEQAKVDEEMRKRFGEAEEIFKNEISKSIYAEYKVHIDKRKSATEVTGDVKVRKSRAKLNKFGRLALTADDHKNLNSTPDQRLIDNPSKAAWEVMSEEEIVNLLDAARERFDDPKTPQYAALNDFNFFRSSIGFLKSVGKLPEKFSSAIELIS